MSFLSQYNLSPSTSWLLAAELRTFVCCCHHVMVSVTVYAVPATYYDVRQWRQKRHGNEPAVFVRPWTVDQPLTSLLHRTTDPLPS